MSATHYPGEVQGTKGAWLGVEWDDALRGKHAGVHAGKRYFQCLSRQPTAASFVRPTRAPDPPREFVDAVRHKYASEEFGAHGVYTVSGFQDDDSAIRISGKEVEEVGFDKIRKQLANLRQLRILLVDTLCVHRPSARRPDSAANGSDLSSDVAEACPNIKELDVSRNLFESWSEVMDICRQLPLLTNLRVEGNRFSSLEHSLPALRLNRAPFTKMTSLGLDETLLSWRDVGRICQSFPQLTTLSLNGNEYRALEEVPLPQSLENLSLETNEFQCLEDVEPLRKLSSLKRLNLKANSIKSTRRQVDHMAALKFSASLKDVDLAYNSIESWIFIDSLAVVFPGMTALRISHNPLYQALKGADGKELLPEDGYMLTMARLGQLQRLNFSALNAKERLNAEVYYLSQITRALALAGPSGRDAVLAEHARYEELCRIYDQPTSVPEVQAPQSSIDSRSLAAALATVTFTLAEDVARSAEDDGIWTARIPKSCSIYTIQGLVGKHYGVPPMQLRLVWETGEQDVVQQELDEDGDDEEGTGAGTRRIRMREDVLMPQTRPLGTWVDEAEAAVRVEWNEVAVKRAAAARQLFASS